VVTLTDVGNVELAGRTAIVTGASSGLGEATTAALARAGATVVLAVRSQDRGRAAADRIRTVVPHARLAVAPLELSSLDSVAAFAEQYADRTVDVLVNNADTTAGRTRTTTPDGFELAMGTNHLGHFALTVRLLPALLRSDHARVVHLSSLMTRLVRSVDPAALERIGRDGSQGDARPYDPGLAYGQSKMACAVTGIELDRRAKMAGAHLCSVVADPGWASTGLFAAAGGEDGLSARATRAVAASSESAARVLVRAATDLTLVGGEYLRPHRLTHGRPVVRRPQAHLTDPRTGQVVWELSERATGCTLTFRR